MTDPAPHTKPPEKPAPPPRAPGFAETFETSLAALAIAPAVFRRLAARPAPSAALSASFALSCGAAALVIQLLRVALERPGLLQSFPPAWLAAVGVASLGLIASAFLLVAVFLYGLGNALGGRGEFDRAWQAAAALSVLAPVQALCGGLPAAWAAPALLAGWVAAGALEGLFAARPWPARALCGVAAAAAVGVQFAVRAVADRAVQGYELARSAAQTTDAAAQLTRQMQALQAAMPAPGSPAPLLGPDAPGAPAQPAPAAPDGGMSSLDLLRGPADVGGPAPAPSDAAPPAPDKQVAAVNASAVGMLDSVQVMLNNPAITANMTPQMKADMKEIQGLMADMRAQGVSGRRLSNEEFSKRMQRVQALSMRLMAGAAQAPAAAPAPTAPHLKISGGNK